MSLKWWIILLGIAVAGIAITVACGWIWLLVFVLCDVLLTALIAGCLGRSADTGGVIRPNCRRRDLMKHLDEGSISIVDGEVRQTNEDRKADS